MYEKSYVNETTFLLWSNSPSWPWAASLLTFLYHNTDTNPPNRTSSLVISALIHQLIISYLVFHRIADSERQIFATVVIIIIITISFMQGIYTYIPETKYVPREYSHITGCHYIQALLHPGCALCTTDIKCNFRLPPQSR